jgi:Fuc2NAc and GlcNAc transferase
MHLLAAAALAAFFVSLVATPLARALAYRMHLFDRPNERSSHVRPTPRLGGVAILAGTLAAMVAGGALRDRGAAALLAAALPVAALGLIDDIRGLRQWPKLAVQLLAGGAAVLAGGMAITRLELPLLGAVPLGPAAIVASLVWLVWLLNAYNFMDGVNGIAGTQAVVAGACLSALLAGRGDVHGAVLAAGVAAAAAGFLPWNFPRASIFMGDVGSTTLGFVFALLSLRLAHTGAPFVAAVLPLFPFLFDATLTVLVRMVRGERFFSTPHRLHLYQRLLSLGWSHTRVTLLWGVLALAGAAAGLAYAGAGDRVRALLLAALLAVHGALALWVMGRTPLPPPDPAVLRPRVRARRGLDSSSGPQGA